MRIATGALVLAIAACSIGAPPGHSDGGWVATVDDPSLEHYRTDHGPCEIAFRR